MTILEMSFFVILLAGASSKSSTDDDILKMLATIKAGFGYVPKADSTDKLDLAVLQILAHRRSKIVAPNQIRPSNPAVSGEQLRDRDLWVQVKGTIGKAIIFEENSFEIPYSQEPRVEEVAAVLRNQYKVCVVQGHCTPQETERDPKGGYEISFRRAMALKDALERKGIPSGRMRIVACSSYDQFRETKSSIQRRAVVTMGNYYLPGGDPLELAPANDAADKKSDKKDDKKDKAGH